MKKPPAVIPGKNGTAVKFLNFSAAGALDEASARKSTGGEKILEVVTAGCRIDDFGFLRRFPALRKLSFLACTSDCWQDLRGTDSIASLRLHNLKEGKRYLSRLDFLHTFPHLEYLYIAMTGIERFPDLRDLQRLHTLFGSFRNENDKKRPVDFTALEFQPNLKVFSYNMAVDRQRIPAASLIPVLKNPSLTSITVVQMYATEEKELARLIECICPAVAETTLHRTELYRINGEAFAW